MRLLILRSHYPPPRKICDVKVCQSKRIRDRSVARVNCRDARKRTRNHSRCLAIESAIDRIKPLSHRRHVRKSPQALSTAEAPRKTILCCCVTILESSPVYISLTTGNHHGPAIFKRGNNPFDAGHCLGRKALATVA